MTVTVGAYAAEHASAHARVVAAKGVPVTFTKGANSIPGVAVRVRGKSQVYLALSLIQSESPTLLFVADTYGDAVPLGATVTFGGTKYVSRDIDPVAPDGLPIMSRVIVVK